MISVNRTGTLLSASATLISAIFSGVTPILSEDRSSSSIEESSPDNRVDHGYVSEIQRWREANEKSLKAPGGWLALTAHAWLKEGRNDFGPGSHYAVPLPDDAPSNSTGSFHVTDNSVVLNAAPLAEIYVNEKRVEGSTFLEIAGDGAESDGKDKIRIGDRLTLQLVRRTGRLAIRVRDSESPLIRSFSGKSWYDPDPAFRVEARYTAFDSPRSIPVQNVRGDAVNTVFSGQVQFELKGQRLTLDAIEETPGKLFIIFKDKTNGVATYPSGRFLMADVDSEGRVVLDFNKAYNPPCAFSPHTLCPVPPAQNRLPIPLTAGETHQ